MLQCNGFTETIQLAQKKLTKFLEKLRFLPCLKSEVHHFRTLQNIYDGTFCENSWRLLVYFHKNFHDKCLAGLKKPWWKFELKRIEIARCDLFFHYGHAKEITSYYFRDAKLCAKHEKHRWIPFILLGSCL